MSPVDRRTLVVLAVLGSFFVGCGAEEAEPTEPPAAEGSSVDQKAAVRRVVNQFALSYFRGEAHRACELASRGTKRLVRTLAVQPEFASLGDRFESCLAATRILSRITGGRSDLMPSALAAELRRETAAAIESFRADEGIETVVVDDTTAFASSPYFENRFRLTLFNGGWRIERTGLPPSRFAARALL